MPATITSGAAQTPSEPRAASSVGTSIWRWTRAVVAMSRPRFWLVSMVALYLGFVLATRRLLPHDHEIMIMMHVGLIVGPLLWLSVLSINDAYDLASDGRNLRKAGAPVVTGWIAPRQAVGIGMAAGAVAIIASLPRGGLFTLGVALVVLLGWAYSAPPLRLKARPGADVVINAFAVALLGPLGGWVAVTESMRGFPWPIAIVGLLAVAALYLPTTMVDHDADREAGARTTAVVLGKRATFELGFALWVVSAAVAAVLAFTGVVIERSLLPLHLIMTPVLLVSYRVLLKERPTFPAIMVVAGSYLLPCGAFALTYIESI